MKHISATAVAAHLPPRSPMGKRAYRDALNLRLGELSHRAVLLQLRWEHAKGFEKFRTLRQIESVVRRKRLL